MTIVIAVRRCLGRIVFWVGDVKRERAVDAVERDLGAQDGAAYGFRNLRDDRVPERFDDETGRSLPARTPSAMRVSATQAEIPSSIRR